MLSRVPLIRNLFLRKSNRIRNHGRVVYYPIHAEDLQPEPLTHDPISGWTNKSRRCGLLTIKLGMMHSWNEWGVLLPITVLKVDDNQVLQIKTKAKDGINALQIGAGRKKLKHTTKPLMGHFARADVAPKRTMQQFPITPDAVIPVGTTLYARHFLAGQYVDASGKTIGKGFQGGMKRWGFKGQPASHGVSLAHRSIGSTGARKDPAKVWKGKKMPGRMGGKNATLRNLKIFEIYPQKNLLLVVGGIPGKEGTRIRLRDATGKAFFDAAPPFPTYFPNPDKPEPEILRGTFKKPGQKDEAKDEHTKKMMTDPKYRNQYILKNASRIQEMLDRAAKVHGVPRTEASKKLLFKKVNDKTLSEITKKHYKYLNSIKLPKVNKKRKDYIDWRK